MNRDTWRVEEFLRVLTAAAPATIDAYRRDLKGFIAWSHDLGHSDPQAIGRREVRGWVAKMSGEGYAPRTIARQLSALRRYFGWLLLNGLIDVDPTSGISAPAGDARLPRVLQLGEIEQLFDDTTPENSLELRNRLTIELLYGSGLRVAELCGLNAANLSKGRAAVEIFGKGAKIYILAPVVRSRKGKHKGVFDQIRKEGFLRIRIDGTIYSIDENIDLEKNKKHSIEVVIDRLVLENEYKERLTESIELSLKIGSGLTIVHQLPNQDHLFSEHFACPHCEVSMEELAPRMFSFNSPYGACPHCDGIGSHMEIDPEMIVPDKTKSLIQGAIIPLGEQPRGNWYGSILKSLSSHYNFSFTTPWYKLNKNIRQILLNGTGDKKLKMDYSSERWSGTYTGGWEGTIPNLMRRYKQTKSNHIRDWIEQFMSMRPCPKCLGSRLKEESRAVTTVSYTHLTLPTNREV